jgi:hypothetical protein
MHLNYIFCLFISTSLSFSLFFLFFTRVFVGKVYKKMWCIYFKSLKIMIYLLVNLKIMIYLLVLIFQISGGCHLYWWQANLDLCFELAAFSNEGSFTCHTYCDTVPLFLKSYPKDPWFSLLNAVLLAKEHSLPISNVLGLMRPAWAGIELTTSRMLRALPLGYYKRS